MEKERFPSKIKSFIDYLLFSFSVTYCLYYVNYFPFYPYLFMCVCECLFPQFPNVKAQGKKIADYVMQTHTHDGTT